MKKIIKILLILICSSSMYAQNVETTVSNVYNKVNTLTDYQKKWYVGASGGYLFNNKKLNTNPMWFLKSGAFAELNGGWRKKSFGWDASIGYLKINRDDAKFDKVTLNSKLIYANSVMNPGSIKPSIADPFEGNLFTSLKASYANFIKKDYSSMYLLTGPSAWIGKKKLQVQLKAEGGIGLTKTGYYYMNGQIAGKIPLLTTPSVTTVAINSGFSQYGMSTKYYNDFAAANAGSTTVIEPSQKSEINFMGRLSANAEYFISPTISIHGGANFWYIKPPSMSGQQFSSGFIAYTTPPTNQIGSFNYVDNYTTKDLTYLSANVGVKYWMGKEKKKEIVKPTPAPPIKKEDKTVAKNITILVKDKCTGVVLPNVNVNLKSDGAKINNAYTNDEGKVVFNNITPQVLDISGVKNEVSTNTATINKSEFNETASEIIVTLLHDDPRFTLIGTTVDENANKPIENVAAVITNLTNTTNRTAISNAKGSFYEQLEQNSDFKIVGQAKGKFSAIKQVSTKNIDRCKDLYVRLEMPMEEIAIGKKVVLKNIYYDVDKAEIRTDAALELNNVVEFMKTNPTVKIELGSHTDSRSSDDYNLKLSQRRANAAVNYIVSKGIDSNRLSAKGYGESQLVNGCANGVNCTEAQHQENRRTEIKILEQ